MVIFHSYVSLPEGISDSHDVPIQSSGSSVRLQESGWLYQLLHGRSPGWDRADGRSNLPEKMQQKMAERPWNIFGFMDMYGGMNIYGCLWMFLVVYACLWMFMAVYGCLKINTWISQHWIGKNGGCQGSWESQSQTRLHWEKAWIKPRKKEDATNKDGNTPTRHRDHTGMALYQL